MTEITDSEAAEALWASSEEGRAAVRAGWDKADEIGLRNRYLSMADVAAIVYAAVQPAGHVPPPLSANSPETRRYWAGLTKDLAELELRGALGGIRAIIAERLRQVREGWESHDDMPNAAKTMIRAGRPDTAAALLAAEIDRQCGGQE